MSATITYKGETLTTATNQTRVLETEGKYLEDDITITDVTGAAPSGTKNISITANGTTTEDVTSYATASITTAVPASAVDSGTKSISTNGTHDVIGYASANVAVPNSYSASDEGKVVSSGALVSQTAHADVIPTTSDQTIDTTTNNSIKVKGDADLVAGNIKKDVEIFGVTGSYEGGGGSIGGLANMVDVNNAEYAFAFILSQMKNGNTVGGTVTYSQAFPNTETLVLQTGLQTIHGIMFACPTYDMTTSLGSGQSNKFFMMMLHSYQETPAHYWALGFTQSNSSANVPNRVLETQYASSPEQGTFRIDGGDIYFTARYNKNANYQFVRPNVQYEWLAW